MRFINKLIDIIQTRGFLLTLIILFRRKMDKTSVKSTQFSKQQVIQTKSDIVLFVYLDSELFWFSVFQPEASYKELTRGNWILLFSCLQNPFAGFSFSKS